MTHFRRATFLVTLLAAGCPAFASLLGVNSDDGNLYSVSATTAALTLIGNTGIAGAWADIAFAPNGTLYGFTDSAALTPTLYTIDPGTAAVTPIGPLDLPFVFEGGLAFASNTTAYGTNGGNAGAA